MALTLTLPAWRHLPREARDTLFLLAVIGWTVMPHVSHLPVWCSLLTVGVLVWRAWLAVTNGPLPNRWVIATAGSKYASPVPPWSTVAELVDGLVDLSVHVAPPSVLSETTTSYNPAPAGEFRLSCQTDTR